MAKAATKTRVQEKTTPTQASASAVNAASAITLDATTRGKFVVFGIPAVDRVEEGPVMRGFIETETGKINLAGWKKNGRESGTEYLSLKVGNPKPRAEGTADDATDEWLIGPFYGRLFKEVVKVGEQTKVKRYFGFIEDSQKIGEEPGTHKGVYRTNWQIQIKAKPDISTDQKTHYINGSVFPRLGQGETSDDDLPF